VDPIKCNITDWTIDLYNFKRFIVAADGSSFIYIELVGIMNPESVPTGKSIAAYIMSSSTHAREFQSSIGTLSFTTPP